MQSLFQFRLGIYLIILPQDHILKHRNQLSMEGRGHTCLEREILANAVLVLETNYRIYFSIPKLHFSQFTRIPFLSIRNPIYSISFAKKRHLLLFTVAPTSFKISNIFSFFFKCSTLFFPVINMSSILTTVQGILLNLFSINL